MPASPKPAKGTARKAKKKRRRRVVTREQTIMRQARARDGNRCQARPLFGAWGFYPFCPGPIDVCHRHHRGMGGNPKGDRTVLADLICLCRHHHQMLDSGRLRWEDIR